MKSVVLISLDPATVDFSDPALPPGMTAEKIHAGVKLALADFAARGWHAQNCFINPDKTAVPTVERCLAGHVYDCVVIGAGLRLPPSRLVLFEAVVNGGSSEFCVIGVLRDYRRTHGRQDEARNCIR